jgi:hypothetical protein
MFWMQRLNQQMVWQPTFQVIWLTLLCRELGSSISSILMHITYGWSWSHEHPYKPMTWCLLGLLGALCWSRCHGGKWPVGTHSGAAGASPMALSPSKKTWVNLRGSTSRRRMNAWHGPLRGHLAVELLVLVVSVNWFSLCPRIYVLELGFKQLFTTKTSWLEIRRMSFQVWQIRVFPTTHFLL